MFVAALDPWRRYCCYDMGLNTARRLGSSSVMRAFADGLGLMLRRLAGELPLVLTMIKLLELAACLRINASK